MKRLLLLLTLSISFLEASQYTIPFTTLEYSVNNYQGSVFLASNANVMGPGQPVSQGGIGQPAGASFTILYIDSEAMRVTAAVPMNGSANSVQVERGWSGTASQAHNAGATVWVAVPQYFTYTFLSGACNAATAYVLPVIDAESGTIFTCPNGTWVGTGGMEFMAARPKPVVPCGGNFLTRLLRKLHLKKACK